MAPKTRSQGIYTHPALHSSPSVSENEEDQNSTPKKRKPRTKLSISSQQKDLACTADPNGRRCLITRRGTPIDTSHLVAQATKDDILTKLEYVWMVGYEQLNVDSRYNIFFLRVDWHRLFDHKEWMLVPQIHILRELKRIYLVEGHKSFNLAEVFTDSIYKYYLLPAPTLQEYICRFPEENTHHAPPYPNLGALPSHVRPHFVVFNTGLKLRALGEVKFQLLDMMRNIVPRLDEAVEMLLIIESLYRMWTEVEVPKNHFSYPSHSPQSHHPEAGQESPSGSASRPKRRRVESPEFSSRHTQGSYHPGRQHCLDASSSASDSDEVESIDGTDEDNDWVKRIHTWRVETEGRKDQWEHTCTTPSSEDWTVTTAVLCSSIRASSVRGHVSRIESSVKVDNTCAVNTLPLRLGKIAHSPSQRH